MKLLLKTHSTNEHFDGIVGVFLELHPAMATEILARKKILDKACRRDSNVETITFYSYGPIWLEKHPDSIGGEDFDMDSVSPESYFEVPDAEERDYQAVAARTECDRVVIGGDEVYWRCYPKHCDWIMETHPLNYDVVRKALEVSDAAKVG